MSSLFATSLCGLAVIGWATATYAAETILYSTDFENFPVGDDQLVGNGGWSGTYIGQGVHGTIDDVFAAGNRGGSIGYGIPSFEGTENVVSVWRTINEDPVASDERIRFSADIAIIDSDNERYDSFYLSVYNQNTNLLAAVVFDNTIESEGIWRYDGTEGGFVSLDPFFEIDKLYAFSFTIDFANNLWSASLDDITLFEDATFTERDVELDLGDIAAEWEVTDAANPGTNWLYFDNWTVTAISQETDTGVAFAPSIVRGSNGSVTLNWPASNGETFLVEYSSDLVAWKSDLAGSTVTVQGNAGARFVDGAGSAQAIRFYRVSRR